MSESFDKDEAERKRDRAQVELDCAHLKHDLLAFKRRVAGDPTAPIPFRLLHALLAEATETEHCEPWEQRVASWWEEILMALPAQTDNKGATLTVLKSASSQVPIPATSFDASIGKACVSRSELMRWLQHTRREDVAAKIKASLTSAAAPDLTAPSKKFSGTLEPALRPASMSKHKRRNILDPSIDAAQDAVSARGGDPCDVSAVWVELRNLALESKGPFSGLIKDGFLRYTNAKGVVASFNVKALGGRLRRRENAR